jgi:hypothetical protein
MHRVGRKCRLAAPSFVNAVSAAYGLGPPSPTTPTRCPSYAACCFANTSGGCAKGWCRSPRLGGAVSAARKEGRKLTCARRRQCRLGPSRRSRGRILSLSLPSRNRVRRRSSHLAPSQLDHRCRAGQPRQASGRGARPASRRGSLGRSVGRRRYVRAPTNRYTRYPVTA